MQIKGIGNNQIGNSYQNPNRMPNSTTGKKEDEDVNKRLEALGVKVELSYQQTGEQSREQEVAKETVDTGQAQESFSVLTWVKKIWDAGIAWLKSIWNDEAIVVEETQSDHESDRASEDVFEADAELVAETPLDEDADYAAVHVKGQDEQLDASVPAQMTVREERFDYSVSDDEQVDYTSDKFRTSGTPLHTSGMQDSYNRYGQHSKLGVEPTNNMTVRK